MRLFLIFAFLLTVGSARADELTAGDLYSFCASNDKIVNTACRYYILGVVNGVRIGDSLYMGANRTFLERKKTILCNPDNMPQSEMVSLITDLLALNFKAYPEDKALPADTTIAAAMSRKFPCPK
jgi:hypothetical protein